MDVSDRRMQVQLTRKFCLRQNLSPRRFCRSLIVKNGRHRRLASPWACNLATGFVDPEGLGKSTCRKQKSPLIFYISGRFLRLWALSALWAERTLRFLSARKRPARASRPRERRIRPAPDCHPPPKKERERAEALSRLKSLPCSFRARKSAGFQGETGRSGRGGGSLSPRP